MIMIALVSDQRMQNLIPVFQEGSNYSEVILVLSKDRSDGKPLPQYIKSADDLAAVLGDKTKVNTYIDAVDPFNIEDIDNTIRTVIGQFQDKQDVVVNISGGTKPMAIGALKAAQISGVKSLYTNTEDNELIFLYPDDTIVTESINVPSIKIAPYIRAYGEQVSRKTGISDIDSKSIEWADTIGLQHQVIYKEIIFRLTEAIKKAHMRCPVSYSLSPTHRQLPIIQSLHQLGLWQWDQNNNQIIITEKANAIFLNGGWVEIFVAMQMHRSGCFDEVLLNVKLEGIEGEMDIVAVSNGKLAVVECKSNVQRSEQLNKLYAFRRRLGGPFAHAYYARASNAYINSIKKQSQKLGINEVFFGEGLRDIGMGIGKRLGSKTCHS